MHPNLPPLPGLPTREGEFRPPSSGHPLPSLWGYANTPMWSEDGFLPQDPHRRAPLEGDMFANGMRGGERPGVLLPNAASETYFVPPSNGFRPESHFHPPPNFHPGFVELNHHGYHPHGVVPDSNARPDVFVPPVHLPRYQNGFGHKASVLSEQESREHGAKLLSLIRPTAPNPSVATAIRMEEPSLTSNSHHRHGTNDVPLMTSNFTSVPIPRYDASYGSASERWQNRTLENTSYSTGESELNSVETIDHLRNNFHHALRLNVSQIPANFHPEHPNGSAAVQASLSGTTHNPPFEPGPPTNTEVPEEARTKKKHYERDARNNRGPQGAAREFGDFLCTQENKKLILDHYFGSMDVAVNSSHPKADGELKKETARKNYKQPDGFAHKHSGNSSNSKQGKRFQQVQQGESKEPKLVRDGSSNPLAENQSIMNPDTVLANSNMNADSPNVIQKKQSLYSNHVEPIDMNCSNTKVDVNTNSPNMGHDAKKNGLIVEINHTRGDSKHVNKTAGTHKERKKHNQNFQYRKDILQISSGLLKIYESLIPSKEERARHHFFFTELEAIITNEWKNAQLFSYGSCANNFGLKNSDIDVCLKLDLLDIPKGDFITQLADVLVKHEMQNVQALPHARVPVVKFKSRDERISCDICVNNILAIVNTKLLKDYSMIDDRLCQLAFLVKHWAKCRKVNEPYHGTLSSYAYVLMCIHFLQRRKPAILPCLQNLEHTYSVVIDDQTIGYYDQVHNLSDFGVDNKEKVGELLTSFFEYWAHEHDYKHDVISIRTAQNLSKEEKGWTKKVGNERHLLCIEDPFDLSHDLGRVIDRNSIQILRDEFRRASDVIKRYNDPCTRLFERILEDSSS